MSTRDNTILFLGATGFLGSQFLILLNRAGHKFHIVSLVRHLSDEKKAQLKELYANMSFVEASLNDLDVISREAAKVKYVVNAANSDHPQSIQAVLDGLEKNSAANPGNPPLYLHVSGLCITGDNARGEPKDEKDIPRYTDTEFTVDSVPVENPHVNCDSQIMRAYQRKENPIRTIIAFPAWIFGLGEGYRKSSGGVRVFIEANRSLNWAGYWGKGENSFNNIHIADCSRALLTIFEAALQGKADEGPQGYYFISSDEPTIPWKDYSATIGDLMFAKGKYTRPGAQPYPPAVADAFGDYGWRLLGGNIRVHAERLKKLGWEPVVTKQRSMMECLPEEVDMAFHDLQPVNSILKPTEPETTSA